MTQEYKILFNAISCAIESLNAAQIQAEDAYLFSDSLFVFRGVLDRDVGIVRAQTIEEACDTVSAKLGKPVEVIPVPDEAVYFASP